MGRERSVRTAPLASGLGLPRVRASRLADSVGLRCRRRVCWSYRFFSSNRAMRFARSSIAKGLVTIAIPRLKVAVT